jgi:hypothetical protein
MTFHYPNREEAAEGYSN